MLVSHRGLKFLFFLVESRMSPNTERDRKIHEAVKAGRSIKQLSEMYRLTSERIVKIITAERHKRAVSPDTFYRAVRDTNRALTDRGRWPWG